MKLTALISSLLVDAGALATSIVVSQTSSYDPMNNFIEYEGDERTNLQSVQKINELIQKVKDAFQKLKEKIKDYEQVFKDAKIMLKDEERKKIGNSRLKN